MNEKNGNDIESENMEWSENDEVEYWKSLKNIKRKKIIKVFIFATIGIFFLLIILKFPFIVAVVTGICIALIGWGTLIETHGGDVDSKPNVSPARIGKTIAIAIPGLILIGFIALGIEHSLKTNKNDVLGISRKFAISFIGGFKNETLAFCFDEQRKEIGEDFNRIRLLGDSFKNLWEGEADSVYPSKEKVNLETSLVAFSRLGPNVVCTYETRVWHKPVFLNIHLLSGENFSLWEYFLRSVHSIDYFNYLFPSPEERECWMVLDFKVDDDFEKVLKKELGDDIKFRRTTKRLIFGDGKLNENEKKEYEKALEEFKSITEKFSREDYRKQLEQKRVEIFGNWAVNEIQRQLDQAKALRANFEKMFD